MIHKIRLSKDGGFRFAKNGDILCGIAKVGEWRKDDVWKRLGKRAEHDGTRYVHYLWRAKILGRKHDFICNTRTELRNAIDGLIVEVMLDF